MKHPIKAARMTAGFDQPRPLSVPPEDRDHVHGAIDLAAVVNTPIVAPEPGEVHYWAAFRSKPGRRMIEASGFPFNFRGHNYFYDVYGGMAVLFGISGMTHIFAHSYMNQLFNRMFPGLPWVYAESPNDERFPSTAFYTTLPVEVREKDRIAYVGNAGYSTGAHSHYEIHQGTAWQPHADRPNPEDIFNV